VEGELPELNIDQRMELLVIVRIVSELESFFWELERLQSIHMYLSYS
jgi:hypothetical protein